MNDHHNSIKLREMTRTLERKFGILEENEVTCCGISMAQCHALIEIGRSKSISLNELAQLLNLDNSTMSRTVNALVNSGLVKREIDPSDRRYITISLEENGAALFHRIEDGMNRYFYQVYELLPQNKQEQVLESLQLLIEAIRQTECCK